MTANTVVKAQPTELSVHTNCFTPGCAAERLGLSEEQFAELKARPDGVYVNEDNRICGMYRRDAILELYDEPVVVEARKHRYAPVDWDAVLTTQYGERNAAMVDAARAMVRLNRYAKETGHPLTSRLIYRRKTAFTRYLWSRGYCVLVCRVELPGLMQECQDCGGIGCDGCGGDGRWDSTGPRRYLGFRFVIDGHSFVWHQWAEIAEWVPEADMECDPGTYARPCDNVTAGLRDLDFASDYALVGWVIDGDSTAALHVGNSRRQCHGQKSGSSVSRPH